ncbi:hypothetical protein [Planktothrix mougeotii]|uniref:AlgX/AlgJ SGNH hydrolase-like domain-containing protein n=1 Tax=Planktothrix mougeotii LEGE 06226 TaxID=1828728 RepID=A0ABR9U9Y7_9CYAN|nr:hypothetical protein [Planktothrix mougeotii]MBE9143265.1 hypothetical protein [Planktothrix mougeotii LEGE 06226]
MKNFKVSPKVKEGIKIGLINLVVLFVFLEIGSLIFYYFKHQKLYYTRDRSEDIQNLGINLEGVRVNESVVERLHPYFGYVQKPGPDFRPGFKYNNYGFISPYDYPYKKTNSNQVIVGVLGGSVASNYSIYEIQNRILETKLQKLPQFKDKELIIISLAIGGYKQPQQLLTLNYMLSLGQKFDFVVNIDGFNEVALASINNQQKLSFAMPSASHVQALTGLANNSLSTKALEALLSLKDNKPKLKNALETLKNCPLASCHVVMSLYVQELVKDYRRDVARFERYRQQPSEDGSAESVIYFYMEEQVLPDAEVFQDITNNWAETSILIHQVLAANNIPYFHILQPNQYYPTKRVFSEAEKKIAFSEDSPYKDSIKKGYPFLLKKVDELKANNVQFFNGVSILDSAQEPVYIDNCCHFNKSGETILSNFVADSLFNVFKNQTTP